MTRTRNTVATRAAERSRRDAAVDRSERVTVYDRFTHDRTPARVDEPPTVRVDVAGESVECTLTLAEYRRAFGTGRRS